MDVKRLTYDDLKNDPGVPKSHSELIKMMIKSALEDFTSNVVKRLVSLLIIFAVVFLFNFIGAWIGRKFWCMSNSRGIDYFVNYLFASREIDYANKGLAEGSNMREIIPLAIIVTMGIFSLFKRVKEVGAKAALDVFRSFEIAKKAKTVTKQSIRKVYMSGIFLAVILGLIIKNPIALVLLVLFLLAEVGKGAQSSLVMIIFLWRVSGNMKEKDPEDVAMSDIILDIYGLAIGFLVYLPVVMIVWGLFNYNVWARVIVSFALAFACFYLSNSKVNKAQKVALLVLGTCLLSLAMFDVINMNAYARDLLNPNKKRKTKYMNIPWYQNNAASSAQEAATVIGTVGITQAVSQLIDAKGGFNGLSTLLKVVWDWIRSDKDADLGTVIYNSVNLPGMENIGNATYGINDALQGHETMRPRK